MHVQDDVSQHPTNYVNSYTLKSSYKSVLFKLWRPSSKSRTPDCTGEMRVQIPLAAHLLLGLGIPGRNIDAE